MTNEKILSIYDKKLASLNIPFRERKIETSFGKTNIIICGDDKKPPLFLVHGLNSAAPFAIDTVSFLLEKHHRTHSQSGRAGDQSCLGRNRHDDAEVPLAKMLSLLCEGRHARLPLAPRRTGKAYRWRRRCTPAGMSRSCGRPGSG